MPRRVGQFLCEDFFINNGGLNTADSPFVVDPSQCTGGKNFDNRKRGGIQKRFGHDNLNAAADTQLKSLGLGLWDKPSATRLAMRAAGRKLQKFDIDAHTFTNLTEDTTTATSDILAADTTQPVVSTMFNTSNAGVLWAAGGGLTALYGMYSSTKVTKNGVDAPGGSISLSQGAGAGTFASTGYYRYGIALRKTSTQAVSNVTLFKEINVSATTNEVTIDLSSVTGEDTTKHDKFVIFRSSVSVASQGDVAFTTGDLVGYANSNATSFVDTGTYTSTSQNVPQAGNTLADNSVLPSGNYNTVALFKRRLVTASGNTVYISDLNASEAWPTVHRITIPAGGDITALGVIGLSSATSTDIDEALCVFQQRKLWVITGDGTITSSIPDWSLKYVNTAGAPGQSSVVQAEGQLAWVNQRGFYIWNGSGKPRYISRSIEDKFQLSGDIDKSKLNIAWGMYIESRGEIQWCLSSKTYGENQYILKLDLRSAVQGESTQLGAAEASCVFTPDVLTFAAYSGMAFIASSTAAEETVYYGDDAGFIYSGYTSSLDGSNFVDFEYQTPFLHLGAPGTGKRVHKVVAWVLDKGDYDLRLTYWSDFRSRAAEGGARSSAISPNKNATGFLWGNASWGAGTVWGRFSSQPRPVTFNLSDNNSEGDCIKLQFSQISSAKQCLLYGFSVYYTETALHK